MHSGPVDRPSVLRANAASKSEPIANLPRWCPLVRAGAGQFEEDNNEIVAIDRLRPVSRSGEPGVVACSPGQADAQYYRWHGSYNYPYYWSGSTYSPYGAYSPYSNWYGNLAAIMAAIHTTTRCAPIRGVGIGNVWLEHDRPGGLLRSLGGDAGHLVP